MSARTARLPAAAALAAALLAPRPAAAQTGCADPKEADFTRTALISRMTEPMEVEFLPDGRLLVIEKVTGKLLLLKPGETATRLAGQLSVSIAGNHADGLLGIQPDKGFAQNHWLYLYYSPKGGDPLNVLSRFTLAGDVLDMASEKKLLAIKTQRNHCCHSAGDLEAGPDGDLYLSVGDNALVTQDVVNTEAEGTSGNTNDLRGKILRIRPIAFPDNQAPAMGVGSTYAIPEGNLFPQIGANVGKTRPEIYAMGFRNPFRFGIDPRTGWILSGDVGPDDPIDKDEFNLIKNPGNYGWPYFVGNNQAYQVGGKPANPQAPVNAGAANTGLAALPAARTPAFFYGYDGTPLFPNFNMGGRVASAGVRYAYDAALKSATKLPPAFDGKWLIWDWRQRWIRAATLDAQGAVTGFLDLFPAQIKSQELARMSDVKVGPDGALYALQYGWVDYQPSTEGTLYRFDYKRAECQLPVPTGLLAQERGRAGRGGWDETHGAVPESAHSAGVRIPVPRSGGWDVFDLSGRLVH